MNNRSAFDYNREDFGSNWKANNDAVRHEESASVLKEMGSTDLGFRLAYDGECRPFVGCVGACKAPVRRFRVFQERGDWKAGGVGFRLVRVKEET